MRRASRTWRVKTAVWSYGVTYSLSPPRGRKATCPYTELGTDRVCVFIRSAPMESGAHARRRWRRKRRKFSWQPAFGRDRERRASECSARSGAERRAIAMSAVIYEAIILVCRCRDREGCPPISPFLCVPTILPPTPSSPSSSQRERRTSHRRIWTYRAATTCSLFYWPAPAILQPIMDLRGLSAVIRRAGYLLDIET